MTKKINYASCLSAVCCVNYEMPYAGCELSGTAGGSDQNINHTSLFKCVTSLHLLFRFVWSFFGGHPR